MKTTEVNNDIIGKRCKSIFTGLMVTGTIETINITKYTDRLNRTTRRVEDSIDRQQRLGLYYYLLSYIFTKYKKTIKRTDVIGCGTSFY